MEDILASIRRILSEDEQAAKPGEAPADAEVLRLDESMLVAEPAAAEMPVAPEMAVPVVAPPVARPVAAPVAAPVVAAPEPAAERSVPERLIAPEAEAATASAVSTLLRTLEGERTPPAPAVPVWRGGPTLEDMVHEALRPMLKQWLDANLPPLVERLVRAEIERVVSRPVR